MADEDELDLMDAFVPGSCYDELTFETVPDLPLGLLGVS